jgi:hypothetical protein
MADKFSEFIPLSERAVRRDGTMSLKIIQPGWGSSGYYPKEVIERDIPKVFPAGTKMYWNHATATEEMERPEGDLRNLAAVTVSDPIWLESGPNGPGMYAEARPFAGYASVIDEIGGHIGVSIRGKGRHTTGEKEGKSGRIIQEIAAGKSVDFVTEPGAGGAVVQIFESAPNATPLPAPDVATFLSEAGRVLSKANETKLKAALEQLTAVLSLLDSEDTSEAAHWLGQRIKEALSNNDLGERLRNKLHSRFGGKETYVWTRDWSVDDGWVVFEINTKNAAKTYRLGMATTKNDVLLAEDDPVEVRVVTRYEPIVTSSEVSEAGAARQLSTEDAMSEQELKEARTALADRDAKLAETNAALAKMREQLLLREARDFVTGELAKTDLPEITRIRLAGQLARNPIATDGKLDEAAMGKAVETAVTEARAEIATLLGKDGRVTGNGEQPETNGDQPTIEAARVRLNESLAKIGYGGSSNGN